MNAMTMTLTMDVPSLDARRYKPAAAAGSSPPAKLVGRNLGGQIERLVQRTDNPVTVGDQLAAAGLELHTLILTPTGGPRVQDEAWPSTC